MLKLIWYTCKLKVSIFSLLYDMQNRYILNYKKNLLHVMIAEKIGLTKVIVLTKSCTRKIKTNVTNEKKTRKVHKFIPGLKQSKV